MHDTCPVCASPFIAYVRDVPTLRTKRDIPLYVCLDCSSFWNPSGYREDDRVLRIDVEWALGVADRNKTAANKLFDWLETNHVCVSSVAEIGCGIGTLLAVARERGLKGIGYDVNPFAIQHAVDVNKVDAHLEMWTAETETGPVDLYLSISVLEHVDTPRPLIGNLCTAASRQGAALFISVPFLDRDKWDYLLDPDPRKPGTPFFDNDVHVIHYSTKGLMTAMQEFGQTSLELVRGWLWHGILARPPANEAAV